MAFKSSSSFVFQSSWRWYNFSLIMNNFLGSITPLWTTPEEMAKPDQLRLLKDLRSEIRDLNKLLQVISFIFFVMEN